MGPKITDLSIDTKELEKKVEAMLMMHPEDTVELTDLSEIAFDSLKRYFGIDYNVEGIINVLRIDDSEINYTLHITKKR